MPTITIRQQPPAQNSATPSPSDARSNTSQPDTFTATLQFEGGNTYFIEIVNPYDAEAERLLEWYFERWMEAPHLDGVKAREAAAGVATYGKTLFENIFKGDFNVYAEYQRWRGNLKSVEFAIEGDSEFQALHWEALKDPELPRPFSLDCVFSRRNARPATVATQVEASPTVNVLLVTARPNAEKDIGYRTTSRPLLEALENTQVPVNVVLLRPGTYKALEQHLDAQPLGYYHIVHFDAHGGVVDYAGIERAVQHRRLVKQRYGRGELQPFEGKRSFLFLEGDAPGKSDAVEAEELAQLLVGKGIPICILDACQLGQEMPDNERQCRDSLGSRLMGAGMQMVVAMGYSVMASASGRLMRQFYAGLAAQLSPLEAMRRGRRELFNQKERRGFYNQPFSLEDWLLPVTYCRGNVNLQLREFTPEEEDAYWDSQGSLYRFPMPEYGFVGREVEILSIEKALLRRNILLLRGMGGTGKTTLLNYLRQWWQQTHFARDIFYFGYDEKAWTLEQILYAIGKQLYDKYEMARFQVMGWRGQLQKLAQKLRGEPHVLILDNLESVTGQELAIQNTLPEEERNRIRDFLAKLVGGKTKVVLGSRSGEEWLRDATFWENSYRLPGLDKEARSQLAQKILERCVGGKAAEIRDGEEFKRLMNLLGGYPLAMEVVLANLKQQSPSEILAGMEAADVDLDSGSEEKTKSILKCVEYSHSNLSPQAQELLVCLAPFRGFIDRADIPKYAQQLQKFEPFAGYAFEEFDGAIQEAIHWGLLSPIDEDNPGLLQIQPVFPYFLQTKLKAVDEETREALARGYCQHYRGLAGSYRQWMKLKEAEERKLGIFFCGLEYENLYHALEGCVAAQESIDIFFCLFDYFKLTQDIQSKLKLCEWVCQALTAYPEERRTGEPGWEIVMGLDRLANCYLATQQYAKARETYQKEIEFIRQLEGVSEEVKQLSIAQTYHQFGMVAQKLREWEEARRNYQKALDIKIEYGDIYEQASTHHNLGWVAQELREWEEARHNYQKALDIKIEYGDIYEQGKTYHNLGVVAQELREWEEARQNHQKALEIKIQYGDEYSQASTYHQLGRVAEELREWEEARQNFQKALEINIQYGDEYSQASTYHNLGIVAQELREWDEARQNFQKALETFIEYEDVYSQASTYHHLGIVAQELREWDEARQNFQKALEIKIQYGDDYSQASTYFQLAKVAEAVGEMQDAIDYYLKDLQITVEYNDKHGLGISLRNLARFYRAHPNDTLLESAAPILNATVEELREFLVEIDLN